MKRIVTVIILLICVGVTAQAQSPNCFFFGGRVETSSQPGDHKFIVTYGTAFKLSQLGTHTSLWSLSSIDAGKFGSLANNVGFAVGVTPKFGVGLLAGPDIDWVNNTPGGNDATTYVATATGGWLTYDFTDKFGVWAVAKYKFSTQTGNQYPEGSVFGLGCLVRW